MPFTGEEITKIQSEWRSTKYTPEITSDNEILKNDSFNRLIKYVLLVDNEKDSLRQYVVAAGCVCAILEIGIAIGRSQATQELLKDIEKV